MKSLNNKQLILLIIVLSVNLVFHNKSYALDDTKTDLIGVHRYFNLIRNSLKLIRAKKNISNETEYVSSLDCESYYFNLHRLLNDFDQLSHITFPQQHNSPVEILLLESLQEGLKRTVKIDDKGYLSVNFNNAKYNLTRHMNKENHYFAKLDGNSSSYEFPLHDLLISLPITYAYLGTNQKNTNDNYLFKGLLDTKKSKVQIDYFDTDIEFYKTKLKQEQEVRSPIKKESLIDVLEKHIITENKKINPTIVSMSFALSQKNVELLDSIFGDNDNKTRIFFNKSRTDMSNVINNINKDKFIFLIALSNKFWAYTDINLTNSLINFYNKFPNIIFVSQTTYDTESKTFIDLIAKQQKEQEQNKAIEARKLLASKIDFFTILTPGYDIVPSIDTNKFNDLTLNLSSSSYATPILTAIIFNLWSLNPNLTPIEIKKILKETALNINQDSTKAVGYVVNPMKSYKYLISDLIINGYKYLYSRCKKSKVYINENKFILDCNYNDIQGIVNSNIRNKIFYNYFYLYADIYNSVTFDSNTIIVKKKNIDTFKYLRPSLISIEVKKIDYLYKKIRVSFTKQYKSNSYQDITEKMAEISFDTKGMPFLLSEWPIMAKKGL